MKLAANLTLLYGHLPLEARFEAAALDGFLAAEILAPYDRSPAWYADAVDAAGLVLVLINTPMQEGAGCRGWAAVPGAQSQFRRGFDQALEVAMATGCPGVHVMVGQVDGHPPAACRRVLDENLGYALPLAKQHGLTLMLEPLNRDDAAGYFYHRPEQALEIIQAFDTPQLRLQLDFYHCMKEGLDLREQVALAQGWVGHAQIAGVDGRHEPDLSRHGLQAAVEQLGRAGYGGWLGCEYRPASVPSEGLAWSEPLSAAGVLS